jgi:hypothetical protein
VCVGCVSVLGGVWGGMCLMSKPLTMGHCVDSRLTCPALPPHARATCHPPHQTQPSTQARVLGAHFFSPAHVMPLLEIVRTRHTSKQVGLGGACIEGVGNGGGVVVWTGVAHWRASVCLFAGGGCAHARHTSKQVSLFCVRVCVYVC